MKEITVHVNLTIVKVKFLSLDGKLLLGVLFIFNYRNTTEQFSLNQKNSSRRDYFGVGQISTLSDKFLTKS